MRVQSRVRFFREPFTYAQDLMNKFLCSLVLLASLVVAQDKRPNILLCIPDDWSWAHARAYGDTVIKTPTFDAIASRGMLFENSYCASPSCTPSRGAILG